MAPAHARLGAARMDNGLLACTHLIENWARKNWAGKLS